MLGIAAATIFITGTATVMMNQLNWERSRFDKTQPLTSQGAAEKGALNQLFSGNQWYSGWFKQTGFGLNQELIQKGMWNELNDPSSNYYKLGADFASGGISKTLLGGAFPGAGLGTQIQGVLNLGKITKEGISTIGSILHKGIKGFINLTNVGKKANDTAQSIIKKKTPGKLDFTNIGSKIAAAGGKAAAGKITGKANISNVGSTMASAGASAVRNKISGSVNLGWIARSIRDAAVGAMSIRGPGGSLKSIGRTVNRVRANRRNQRRATDTHQTARDIIGSRGPGDFTYEGYGGSQKSISETMNSMSGNCVDGTIAQLTLAEKFGIPAEMIMGTWQGQPHVWARINGRDRDIANYALTGSWSPPAAGPTLNDPSMGQVNIHVHGDIYGYNDFKRKVVKAVGDETRGLNL
jgi:hypothetical protein